MASVSSTMLIRLKETWERTTSSQRWLAGGVAVAVAVAVALGVYLNRPDWTVLVSQADPKDAAEIVAKLQELKVPYQPSGDGYTILVPKAEQYTAKLALAQANLPHGGSVGLEMFDQPKFGSTDFERRINYLRGQQGELERSLARISEVEYANVKLAIPDQSVFVRDQKPVTAAVLVQTKPGRRLSADQITGIINFMSGAVQGLKPESVTIVDQSGRMLSNGAGGAVAQTGDTDPFQNQDQLKTRYERSVQSLLEPLFGGGNVVAKVNLEVALETSKVESRQVGSAVPKQTETTRETNGGTPVTTPTTPPTAPGTPPTYQGQTPLPSDLWKSTTNTTWDVSEEKKVVMTPAGTIKRLSVGIAVNRQDLTPEQIAQIKSMVSGATGATVTDISVTAMAFTRDLTTAPIAATSPLDNRYLVTAVVLAALSLLFLLLFIRRHSPGPQLAMEGLTLPMDGTTGRLLNVTVTEAIEQAAAARTMAEYDPDAKSGGATTPVVAALKKAREPKKPVDINELVDVDPPQDIDLIEGASQVVDESPEVAATLIASWLRGG